MTPQHTDLDARLRDGAQYESGLYAAAMEPGAEPVSVSKSTLADLLERHQSVRAALLRARKALFDGPHDGYHGYASDSQQVGVQNRCIACLALADTGLLEALS